MATNTSNDLTLYTYTGSQNIEGYKTFDCGNEIVNRFVNKKTLRQQAQGPGEPVKVILDEQNGGRLVAFYTIFPHCLTSEPFKAAGITGVGKGNTIPVARLSMLGVSKDYQKQGIGKKLMMNAFMNVKEIAKVAGIAGLYLTADKDAVEFYLKLGFVVLDEEDEYGATPMFIHLASIP